MAFSDLEDTASFLVHSVPPDSDDHQVRFRGRGIRLLLFPEQLSIGRHVKQPQENSDTQWGQC